MKCLVVGSSGLVGEYLTGLMKGEFEVISVSRSSSGSDYKADASDFGKVERILKKEKPDFVVNLAKAGSTDQSESDKEGAWAVNVLVPANLAKLQPRFGYKLVHVSTDWVYEGKESEVYSEESLPYPQNFYSFAKAVADEVVRRVCDDYAILRPECIFGIDRRESNIFCRLRKAVETKTRIKLADDQFSQPIYAKTLARMIIDICKLDLGGVYNAVGPDYVSRYGLGLMFCEEFGWDKRLVEPADSSCRSIRIPKYLRLDTSKAEKEIMRMPSLREQIRELKREDGHG